MAQCRSSFANVAYSAGPSMAAVMVLGLLLAVTARDAANGTREVSSSEANKTREESSKKSQRACFLPNGPQHKEKCEEFENHWVNRTGGRKDKPSPNDDHMGLDGMSKRDIVASLGCFALYTFSQQMADPCVDANLLTELLLCQYDYTEDKDLLLREFNNVKSREDIVKMMEDLKDDRQRNRGDGSVRQASEEDASLHREPAVASLARAVNCRHHESI
ncbi:uncharacterized protein LOC142588513 isoform X1 [Dermacentor variabilis]|uniref:uncharacterized protein LOC142588513 isoform X1 n=1 Tax=Dermacentor variabilis TaxID=34621 RepID=UPI003F5CB68E